MKMKIKNEIKLKREWYFCEISKKNTFMRVECSIDWNWAHFISFHWCDIYECITALHKLKQSSVMSSLNAFMKEEMTRKRQTDRELLQSLNFGTSHLFVKCLTEMIYTMNCLIWHKWSRNFLSLILNIYYSFNRHLKRPIFETLFQTIRKRNRICYL